MRKELVGTVTEEEKSQIMRLHERQLALKELIFTLKDPEITENKKDELYERVVNDLGRTRNLFDKWWADCSSKYKWKNDEMGGWNIDFKTNEIYLVVE